MELPKCTLWDAEKRSCGKPQNSIPGAQHKLGSNQKTLLTYTSIVPLTGDVTKRDDLERLAEIVREDTGYVNLVVANAGMTGPGLQQLKPGHTLKEFVKHAWATPMDDFSAVYELNCTATYYTTLAFLELLDEGNRRKTYVKSQVIATASCASFLRNPMAGYAYCSSKAGVVSMMKCLSTFCVPWGIRFNVIAAGCKFTPHSNDLCTYSMPFYLLIDCFSVPLRPIQRTVRSLCDRQKYPHYRGGCVC
jgi:NAD(P)-dependent dehydrogenase (short-subunit alcohol dehydrogenase family)